MPDTVTIPPKVQKVHDDIEQIKKKFEAIQKLGGDTTVVEEQLKEALTGIIGELASEARTEIIELQESAIRLNQGIRPPMPDPNARDPEIGANDDISRLEEFEEERKRIREKLKHARRHAPAGEDTDLEDGLEEDLDALDKRIRRAAREAARREMRDLNKDIVDLQRGKPKRDHKKGPGAKPKKADDPKQDDDDDDDDDKKPGSGNGGGGGSGDDPGAIDAGIQPGEPVGKVKKALESVPTIFVRNQTSVWAWNARDLTWQVMDFGGDLVEVQTIDGGILAFSEVRAALYDSYLGSWLTELTVPDGVLSEGKAAG